MDRNSCNDFSIAEEIWHSITHGFGLFLSTLGFGVLATLAFQSGSLLNILSALSFGTALIIMFGISTLYHAIPFPKAKNILQQLDHSAIYILIAGTYTPVTLIGVQGSFGWVIFGIVWGFAVLGIYLKIAFPNRFEKLSLILYAVLGWLIVIAAGELFAHVAPYILSLLLAGGVTYTLGIVFYVWESLHLNHAIWHLFVLGGSIFHYFVVVFLILM
jgi:hemolysin III